MPESSVVLPYETAYYRQIERLIDKHRESLEQYADQLLWWNKKVNLVSRSIKRGVINSHIRHSLLSSPFIQDTQRIWDLGSGGGLPGIPLAVIHPNIKFIINDIVSKKVMAAKNISKKLGLNNVEFNKQDFRELKFEPGDSVVTKHAFHLNEFFESIDTDPLEKVIFYKGYPVDEDNSEWIFETFNHYIFTLDHLGDFYEGKALYLFQ